MMLTEQWPLFVLPIVRDEWYQQMQATPSAVADLFGERDTNAKSEYSQGVGAGGLVPEFNNPAVPGSSTIVYDDFKPLFPKTFTVKEYAKGIAIERLLMRTDQQGIVRDRASALGIEYGQTIATHRTSVFLNAFNSGFLGPDNVSLCATNHPNRPDDLTTVFSNKGTAALSYAAIIAGVKSGFAQVNDRNQPMPAIYDTIVFGIANFDKVREIFGAVGKPGTADNDANALANMTPRLDPYLGASKNWYLVDSRRSKQYLRWYWLDRPDLKLDPTSDYNLVARYRGYMAYSFGWNDWRWIYGSEVA